MATCLAENRPTLFCFRRRRRRRRRCWSCRRLGRARCRRRQSILNGARRRHFPADLSTPLKPEPSGGSPPLKRLSVSVILCLSHQPASCRSDTHRHTQQNANKQRRIKTKTKTQNATERARPFIGTRRSVVGRQASVCVDPKRRNVTGPSVGQKVGRRTMAGKCVSIRATAEIRSAHRPMPKNGHATRERKTTRHARGMKSPGFFFSRLRRLLPSLTGFQLVGLQLIALGVVALDPT